MKKNLHLCKAWVIQRLCFLGLWVSLLPSFGQTLPSSFSSMEVVAGLSSPTAMAFLPDQRILVCQQNGRLRVVKNGGLLPTPAITLSVNTDGERGLIGIAVDPQFSQNGYVYLYYSTAGVVRNRVSRFTMTGDLLGNEQIILEFPNDQHMFHNGGGLAFDRTGALLVLTGDDKNGALSQNLESLFGKVLRINPDGTIPAGNPFTGSANRSRIWSYGLRNPFTLSVDPVSGRIFVNDVGENTWEEINNASQGGYNYGWPGSEGPCSGTCNPIYAYTHSQGCAISGGTFLNGATSNYPSVYAGKYFFMDYCNGWIQYIDAVSGVRTNFASGLGDNLVGLSQGLDGNLYYLVRSTGSLRRIVYASTCALVRQPQNLVVLPGATATFSVSVTGSNLQYQWRKNSVAIPGATARTYSIASVQSADAGSYSVVISGTNCSLISTAASLSINDSNLPPVPVITLPSNTSSFVPGVPIAYAGSATDPEDGVLPATAYHWEVVFHHETHIHPGPSVKDSLASGSFPTDLQGHNDADIWYRIWLTVTDSKGKSASTYADVFPALPEPWLRTDIGVVDAKGSASFAGDVYAIKGSGADIWGTTDEFQYMYQPMSGDGEFICRVQDFTNTDPWAKAGIMFRSNLTASSPHALLAITPTNGVALQCRTITGAATNNRSVTASVPSFLRMVKSGNVLTAFQSANGTTWTSVGSQTIALGSSFFVGIAVTSHRDGTLATAIVDNISIKKPNLSPTVALTSPSPNALFPVTTTVSLAANAADADGGITKVEFYAGSTLLGIDLEAPYQLTWAPTAEGTLVLTAKAFDTGNASTTSSPITIRVGNQNPSVSLTSPLAGATFTAQASITLTANASDPDGTVARVEFYAGSTLLGVDLDAPFVYTWAAVPEGTYALTTRAFDAANASATSTAVSIKVGNQNPTVSLTSPLAGAVFTSPASISLAASASDADGSITKVDFYQGAVLLASDALAPYAFTWNNVTPGTYTVTARAFDNQGAVTNSLPRVVVVNAPAAIGINGPSCVNIGATNAYILNPEPNFASANWWSNGDVAITPDPANPRRVTLRINSGGGTLTLFSGVKYNASPWYKEYTQSIKIGGCAAREAVVDIAPHPLAQESSVSLSNGADIASIQVFNVQGKLLYSVAYPGAGTKTLSPDLPSGWYTVQVTTRDNETYSAPLVIVK